MTSQKALPLSPASAPALAQAIENTSPADPASAFPIVGIGASAGGLAAFEAFFSGMPAETDPGMAFVLVQHLAPDHESLLTELIRRYTRMQVFEVTDGMVVQPNCAYIIPPKHDMAFLGGRLQLLPPSAARGLRLPIDFFFRSLASDQHERAIGIVLSGTGSDGVAGVRAIKGEGGMVMAQTPGSTEYDGMPRSALATGLVDFELAPADMAAQLMAYAAHAFGPRPLRASTPTSDNAMRKIFILLRTHTGHDFSQYKPSTIDRRIERRMAMHQIAGKDAYVQYLQQTPAEVEALFRDLLIGVTNFFRDPEVFKTLAEKIVPALFAGKPAGAFVRAWSPGCSTGEEAYSLAILLQERLDALPVHCQVQVFATDIDSQAIATARTGIYPASIAADVSPERLARCFSTDADAGVVRIHKNIRDLLVFSEQDLIKDPPFSKLDLISCRNLLIYLDGELQKKLIPLFHYALAPGGFLVLGTSETIGDFNDLFSVVDRKRKIYQRRDDAYGLRRPPVGRFLLPTPDKDAGLSPLPAPVREGRKLPLRELAEQTLLKQLNPVGVLVNAQGDILYLHGRSGQYLEPPPGEVGVSNVLRMAREGLPRQLGTALYKAKTDRAKVRCPGIRVKTNGDFTSVDLTITPVTTDKSARTEDSLFMIILEPSPSCDYMLSSAFQARARIEESALPDGEAEAGLAALKQELRAKEEYLQTTIEELETSNEELRSSNEEMQSINEELQSTNEEMETSKEELQSVNEELATVNAELQNKLADLSQANNDMSNLLAGTGIATVFVDHRLRILRFTPAATRIINLIQGDVGRPVGHIVSNLVGYNHLVEDVQAVLDTLIPQETDVQIAEGKWYSMRILPYRTMDNVIEGVVITFVDITEKKQSHALLEQAHGQLRLVQVARDSKDAVVVHALDGSVMAWNPAAERLFGWTEAEALSMRLGDMLPENMGQRELEAMRQCADGNRQRLHQTQRLTKDGNTLAVKLTASSLINPDGRCYAIAATMRPAQEGGRT
ncbi:MAG: PAS domain S-box [Solidesulfovibrio magneticus str. Maddingley MBC34]|uniref:protein-glutamate O-methyltransferase n=1 Tax=Solidesulfovibrio magneticus str. Maddingley MBC34 TaxID=1206767 RepID=K6HBK7_9BACT|nr:MAG: PAS domain S-box [Solidesulfovibrio magneticus str. Maddingley MBC34]